MELPKELNVIKRDGSREKFDIKKTIRGVKSAFKENKKKFTSEVEKVVKDYIKDELAKLNKSIFSVSEIQDIVELAIMHSGNYYEARNFILFQQERNKIRDIIIEISSIVKQDGLLRTLKDIVRDFPELRQSLRSLLTKFKSFQKEGLKTKEQLSLLTRSAVENITEIEPNWEYVAGRLLLFQNTLNINEKLSSLNITSFYDKLSYMTNEGLYGLYILQSYTKDEVDELATYILDERNYLLTYSALDLLIKRYTVCTFARESIETPQEMFLGIAMHLCMNEDKSKRLSIVRDTYDMLSKLQVTMATPTISNSRKPHHQMSSCFIDTVPDSLDGIYRSITNFAKVSKMGGGMGMYFGKVRASGSDIRGFKGAAGGVIRWIRLANDTAVAVDQLGVRAGSVACYLDVWHKDILDFLQVRTNNGDDRMKAHDIFPAVCYPDLFWKMVDEDINQPWYLMCPHEIRTIKGYELEDYYGEEWEKRYLDCINDNRIPKNEIQLKELVRLIIRSAYETGTPFAFFRDTVNRANPNKHKGMIYSSNLCVEIAQNMSPIQHVSTTLQTEDGDTVVLEKTIPGDFVVCNLASLVLSRINFDDESEVEKVMNTVVRALDNVIDLNKYPIEYARHTNQTYRPIGLGTMGYHHHLALKGISWESDKHLEEADRVYELINYYAIKASMELAKEKGYYTHFDGSDWQNGNYFTDRGYTSERWQKLSKEVSENGLRNGYLLAVAPTASTGVIAGTTACCDPVMNKYFLEEKKGSMIPRVAPDLNNKTTWLYKTAYNIDQLWSIKAAGVRQRHIDQSQSINLYITTDYKMSEILALYKEAWKQGLKTVYYVRSKSLEVVECSSCAS